MDNYNINTTLAALKANLEQSIKGIAVGDVAAIKRQVIDSLTKIVRGVLPYEAIQIHVSMSSDCEAIITPLNIYTGMLLAGEPDMPSYESTIGKTEYTTFRCTYVLKWEQQPKLAGDVIFEQDTLPAFYIKPHVPVQYISVGITIK